MIIGTKYWTYNEKRYIDAPNSGVKLKRIHDVNVVLNSLSQRVLRRTVPDLVNKHVEMNWATVNGYHFWNGVSDSWRPWVTSFEQPIPWNFEKVDPLAFLVRDECRAVFFRSEWTKRVSDKLLASDPRWRSILNKSKVIYSPEVARCRGNLREKNQCIEFLFIGRDFFRKGGLETLRAFVKLNEQFKNARLTIISRLGTRDWPVDASVENVATARKIISSSPGFVRHYEEVSHKTVYELIKESHVGICASPQDALANSVAEFMGSGLPVLVTNVAALPEWIGADSGWCVNLPISEYGAIDRSTDVRRGYVSSLLERGIFENLVYICSNPEEINEKGRYALERISKYHSPTQIGMQFREVYSTF